MVTRFLPSFPQFDANWEQVCRNDPDTEYDFASNAFFVPGGQYNVTHQKFEPGTGCELRPALDVIHKGEVRNRAGQGEREREKEGQQGNSTFEAGERATSWLLSLRGTLACPSDTLL